MLAEKSMETIKKSLRTIKQQDILPRAMLHDKYLVTKMDDKAVGSVGDDVDFRGFIPHSFRRSRSLSPTILPSLIYLYHRVRPELDLLALLACLEMHWT